MQYIHKVLTNFAKIRQDNASRPSTPSANKISDFKNQRLQTAAILKIKKKSQQFKNSLTDFDALWPSEPHGIEKKIKI